VIASHADVRQISQPLDTLVGVGAVAYHVAQAPDLVERPSVGQDGLESC